MSNVTDSCSDAQIEATLERSLVVSQTPVATNVTQVTISGYVSVIFSGVTYYIIIHINGWQAVQVRGHELD